VDPLLVRKHEHKPNSNGWAIAAAFAIFNFAMKEAKDKLLEWL